MTKFFCVFSILEKYHIHIKTLGHYLRDILYGKLPNYSLKI